MLKLLFIVEGKENPWKCRLFFVFFAAHFITYIFVISAKLELSLIDGNCFLKPPFSFSFFESLLLRRGNTMSEYLLSLPQSYLTLKIGSILWSR